MTSPEAPTKSCLLAVEEHCSVQQYAERPFKGCPSSSYFANLKAVVIADIGERSLFHKGFLSHSPSVQAWFLTRVTDH